MDSEAFKSVYNEDFISETQADWEEGDLRGEDYEEREPSVDDMLYSKEWAEWQDEISRKSHKHGHSLAWYMGMKGVTQ